MAGVRKQRTFAVGELTKRGFLTRAFAVNWLRPRIFRLNKSR
jgi:hypothetical protein